jgi:hypothetical protein
MTFRGFLYYCAIWGAVAGLGGWALGRLFPVDNSVLQSSLQGMFLGMVLAVVLVMVDLAFTSVRLEAALSVPTGWLVGGVGGLIGGAIGQWLFGVTLWTPFVVLGWALTGLLIGASPGAFGWLAALLRGEDTLGAVRKVINGLLGGTFGGLLGGLLYLAMDSGWSSMLGEERANSFWSPSAIGFAVLGACIGLLIGLAQVVLMDAWVRVEAGFRAGREMILSRAETTIGRAEGCDIPLFGDNGVEKLHAKIVSRGGRYHIEDAGTPGGTFVNGEMVVGPWPLRDGDRIQVGRSSLLFKERARRD